MVRSTAGYMTGVIAALCVALLTVESSAEEAIASERQLLGQPNSILAARPARSGSDGSTLSMGGSVGEIVQVVLATAGVIGLIIVTRAILRRVSTTGVGRSAGVAEVVSRLPLGKGQSLVVLKLPRRVLILHATSTQMTTLTEFTDRDDVAHVLAAIEGTTRDTPFDQTLRHFEGDHHGGVATPEAAEDDEGVVDLTAPRVGLRKMLLLRHGGRA